MRQLLGDLFVTRLDIALKLALFALVLLLVSDAC